MEAMHRRRTCGSVCASAFSIEGAGIGIWGLEFRGCGLGFGVQGFGFRVYGLGFGVWDLCFGVKGSGVQV